MQSYNKEALLNKWYPLVERLNGTEKLNCAVLLENTERFYNQPQYTSLLTETAGTVSQVNASGTTPNISQFSKIAIPMTRRIFPELIANQVCGIQPMSTPTGFAYALRFKYSSDGTEAGHNTIKEPYTGAAGGGGLSTYDGERLDNTRLPNQPGSPVVYPEVQFGVEKQSVTAETRKLKARYSLEAAQDLAAMHSVNVQSELIDLMSYEVAAEIDRELIGLIGSLATTGGTEAWSYGGGSGADGRWEQEKLRTLYTLITKTAGDIAIDTRRGHANFLITSHKTVAGLQSLAEFDTSPVKESLNEGITGASYVGNIGSYRVYRDTFATNDDILVGFKGKKESDTGLIYCPYVPLMFMQTIADENFAPIIGCMTRYGVTNEIFKSEAYYRRITVDFTGSQLV
jgi:hypothetical protein